MSRVRRSRHTPAANGSKWITPSRRWAIYLRDSFACVYCGKIGKLSIDHVIPCEAGGSHHSSNLVTCCLSCNSSKQGINNRKWFARLRERGIDTEKMRHRIARLLRKPLDRKRGRFLSNTRRKVMKAKDIRALQGADLEAYAELYINGDHGAHTDKGAALYAALLDEIRRLRRGSGNVLVSCSDGTDDHGRSGLVLTTHAKRYFVYPDGRVRHWTPGSPTEDTYTGVSQAQAIDWVLNHQGER